MLIVVSHEKRTELFRARAHEMPIFCNLEFGSSEQMIVDLLAAQRERRQLGVISADDFNVLRESREVGSWRSLSGEQRAVYEHGLITALENCEL
jgi:hypothetical protein